MIDFDIGVSIASFEKLIRRFFQQFLNLLFQYRNIFFDNFPYNFMFDKIVSVNQYISKRYYSGIVPYT